MFLGIYNYTTVLSYLNLLIGFLGISLVTFDPDSPHLIYATVCLLICGICDILDGVVSRTKKNRTIFEKKYGIQIDSLADIISFGCLPIFINVALIKKIEKLENSNDYFFHNFHCNKSLFFVVSLFSSFYLLATLIRLSYFNVTSDEKLKNNNKNNEFIGIPVTTAAIIFPLLMLPHILIQKYYKNLVKYNFIISYIYSFCIVILTFLFICSKIKIKKPNKIIKNIFILLSVIIIILLIIIKHKFFLSQ